MTPHDFIAKWNGADGSERANYPLFFNDLCDLLGVGKPQPALADDWHNAYVNERYIDARDGASAGTARYIDTYHRGRFICEAKSFALGRDAETSAPARGTPPDARAVRGLGAERKLFKAKSQAESYARNLPESEPRPPILMVVNVGRFIALYAQFKDNDRAYEMFPDRATYKIAIADLADDAIRERLRQVWLDPHALNPELVSARVTRAVAGHLGSLARELEQAGHDSHDVAGFLTRCLFTLFAEDVQLLPAGAFTRLLLQAQASPAALQPNLEDLWRAMDRGQFAVSLQARVAHFNGKLFKTPDALPLSRAQIETLLAAAKQDWKHVEPAIFGTLIERALDPDERHALGAHFTPRAYVERLVMPTVIEPLRAQWANIQAAAISLEDGGDHKGALKLVRDFHGALCQTRVLDPACGSGNFLYIALEHMKRLEGEVLEQLDAFNAQHTLETEGLAVDPHQFLGIERNPRAAAVAELVLWIGHLQWHFRTRGRTQPPTPVLRDFKNIECRDAVLEWDAIEPVRDEAGAPLTRWDGKTLKPHPVTGKMVPDDSARVALERYCSPRPAAWPGADYVVGNPPFIGAASMRQALGDGYVEALRAAYPAVPESADLVMFWWHCAAQLLAAGRIARFGFITTNSLTQTFNRRVLEAHLRPASGAGGEGSSLHLAFAIPDHPWVDSADGAAVRVAMTVAAPGDGAERLLRVTNETPGEEGEVAVELAETSGLIHPDLTVGANVAGVESLRANENVANRGVQLLAAGFTVSADDAARLDAPGLIRQYRNGKDLADRARGILVIDTFGLSEAELRSKHPFVWQWLYDRAKPERDHNSRATYRDNWWLFGENQPTMRASLAGLNRYIATPVTAKHRIFQFLDSTILPDQALICIALDDAYALGVLSSRVHGVWALAAGGRLGVGNDPRYNKTRCFEPFPFPAATPEQQARIRKLAEDLDAHRKRQQVAHPALTLTGMYNVLAKLRSGEALAARDKLIHEQGLVAVLKQLHDELDEAVLAAYGWSDLPDDATLLERLVALNAERARAEADGSVCWLRPAFQTRSAPAATSQKLDLPAAAAAAAPAAKLPWPADLPGQLGAVAQVLRDAGAPIQAAALAARFTGKRGLAQTLPGLLAALEAVARAQRHADGSYSAT
ncbi:DNA methyltransferase [Thiobacillus sp.]|uniref:class I SAM-dependent DNA methyltransferase n=1 Tax=Thiobacillus sp. TaxID=924 RepID=UPI0025E2DAC8|nr:DNA methyltransferase [Thiobacillus sp.]